MQAIYYAVLDLKNMIPNPNPESNYCSTLIGFAWNHNWACILLVTSNIPHLLHEVIFLQPLIIRERAIKTIKWHVLAIFNMHNCILWRLHYLVILLYANYWYRCLFMICYSGIICLHHASTHLKCTATKQQRFMYRYEFVL